MAGFDLEAEREARREALTRDYAAGRLDDAAAEEAFSRLSAAGSLEELDSALPPEDAVHPPAVQRAPGPPPAFKLLGDILMDSRPADEGFSAIGLVGDIRVDFSASSARAMRLDVINLVGDVKIVLPRRYALVVEMSTVFGHVKDPAGPPAAEEADGMLVLTGFHLAGDVKVIRV